LARLKVQALTLPISPLFVVKSVGKTYLSYSHYLLMGVFYQAFEDALAFPTLQTWCEVIEHTDLVNVNFTLDIGDIEIDTAKIAAKVNATDSLLLVANELELSENLATLPQLKATIDDDHHAEIHRFGHNAEDGRIDQRG
jgi:hypothetical protein